MGDVVNLDLRRLPPFERHARIFEEWARLEVGHTLRIINDHDPKPLYYQFEAEHKGRFEWKYEQRGPVDWVVAIRRTAPDSKREVIKDLIRRLHEGEDPDEARGRGKEILRAIDPVELAEVEQELIEEGVSRNEIRSLCAVHLELFKESLLKPEVEVEPGHPIHTLMGEHRAILGFVEALEGALRAVKRARGFEELTAELEALEGITHHLLEAEKHHKREEEALFPALEESGVVEPPAVMRLDHEDLRARKEALRKAVEAPGSTPFAEFARVVEEAGGYIVRELPAHISKEDDILYPIAVQTIEPGRWRSIKERCDAIGYCCFTPPAEERIGEATVKSFGMERRV